VSQTRTTSLPFIFASVTARLREWRDPCRLWTDVDPHVGLDLLVRLLCHLMLRLSDGEAVLEGPEPISGIAERLLPVSPGGNVLGEEGRRTIDLDPRTVAVLRSWRTAQREESLALGRRAAEHDHVFTKADGSPLHPDYFSLVFERHVAKSELPTIGRQDLRPTHGTILLEIGVNAKIVSERLGHSNPAFTMTVYQHVLPGMQSDAAGGFGEAVFGT